MILQVSTLNFFLMMLFASHGFPAPSASQWKKGGNASEEVSSSQGKQEKKPLQTEVTHYSLCSTRKNILRCCCLLLFGLLKWQCGFELPSRAWSSAASGPRVKRLIAIGARQTSDTTRQTHSRLLDLCIRGVTIQPAQQTRPFTMLASRGQDNVFT